MAIVYLQKQGVLREEQRPDLIDGQEHFELNLGERITGMPGGGDCDSRFTCHVRAGPRELAAVGALVMPQQALASPAR